MNELTRLLSCGPVKPNADLERRVVEDTQARGRTWQVSPDLMGALNSEGLFGTSNPAWKTVLGWSTVN